MGREEWRLVEPLSLRHLAELNIPRLGVSIVDTNLAKLPKDALDLLVTIFPKFALLAVMLLPGFRRVFRFAVEIGFAEVNDARRFDNGNLDCQDGLVKVDQAGHREPVDFRDVVFAKPLIAGQFHEIILLMIERFDCGVSICFPDVSICAVAQERGKLKPVASGVLLSKLIGIEV